MEVLNLHLSGQSTCILTFDFATINLLESQLKHMNNVITPKRQDPILLNTKVCFDEPDMQILLQVVQTQLINIER